MAEQNHADAFLGRGFQFPIQVDAATGRMKTAAYEEDIREAVYLILMTRKGERIRMPEFGCGIHDFAFGTMDYTSLKEMEKSVWEALVLWEPRIRDIEVNVYEAEDAGMAAFGPDTPGAGVGMGAADGSGMSSQAGRLEISVEYVVRTTNNPYNLVFPFYLNEGFGG